MPVTWKGFACRAGWSTVTMVCARILPIVMVNGRFRQALGHTIFIVSCVIMAGVAMLLSDIGKVHPSEFGRLVPVGAGHTFTSSGAATISTGFMAIVGMLAIVATGLILDTLQVRTHAGRIFVQADVLGHSGHGNGRKRRCGGWGRFITLALWVRVDRGRHLCLRESSCWFGGGCL